MKEECSVCERSIKKPKKSTQNKKEDTLRNDLKDALKELIEQAQKVDMGY